MRSRPLNWRLHFRVLLCRKVKHWQQLKCTCPSGKRGEGRDYSHISTCLWLDVCSSPRPLPQLPFPNLDVWSPQAARQADNTPGLPHQHPLGNTLSSAVVLSLPVEPYSWIAHVGASPDHARGSELARGTVWVWKDPIPRWKMWSLGDSLRGRPWVERGPVLLGRVSPHNEWRVHRRAGAGETNPCGSSLTKTHSSGEPRASWRKGMGVRRGAPPSFVCTLPPPCNMGSDVTDLPSNAWEGAPARVVSSRLWCAEPWEGAFFVQRCNIVGTGGHGDSTLWESFTKTFLPVPNPISPLFSWVTGLRVVWVRTLYPTPVHRSSQHHEQGRAWIRTEACSQRAQMEEEASLAPPVKDSGRLLHPKPYRTQGKVRGKVHGRWPILWRKKPEISQPFMDLATGSRTLPSFPDKHPLGGPSEGVEKVVWGPLDRPWPCSVAPRVSWKCSVQLERLSYTRVLQTPSRAPSSFHASDLFVSLPHITVWTPNFSLEKAPGSQL